MEHIRQPFFCPKVHQIADYSPYFWIENGLFSALPKLHWGFWECP
ncbi:hypothetical protein MNB_SUP05-SYMBIONT-4-335 [hydrothermal vent metagenome]|uniref:Uncharacterized protein n=1 Tax=hydrothermal vent metagenome TaxID=652676 RepID=A0A1W1DY01_9ZZZZ